MYPSFRVPTNKVNPLSSRSTKIALVHLLLSKIIWKFLWRSAPRFPSPLKYFTTPVGMRHPTILHLLFSPTWSRSLSVQSSLTESLLAMNSSKLSKRSVPSTANGLSSSLSKLSKANQITTMSQSAGALSMLESSEVNVILLVRRQEVSVLQQSRQPTLSSKQLKLEINSLPPCLSYVPISCATQRPLVLSLGQVTMKAILKSSSESNLMSRHNSHTISL